VVHQRAAAVIEAALECGVTLFDHADIYTRGKSEAVFGDLLQRSPGLRQRMVLQTKCGIRFGDDPVPGTPGRYDFSRAHIISSVEGSLRRLRTDMIDVLLLHRPDPLAEPDEVAAAFDALHHAGKVRAFGVSNHTGAQLELMQRSVRQRLVINQLEFSLLHHALVDEGIMANQTDGHPGEAAGLLDWCRLNHVMVQAWSPLARGHAVSPPAEAAANVRAAAAMVATIAAERGVSGEAIALAWILRHPAGILPVVGTTDEKRIRWSAQADEVELTREEWYRLFTAARGQPVP
jgi:predicted oxidoreductase